MSDGVKYTVTVDKAGNGAQQAVADLQAVGQAAVGADKALARMNSAAQTGTASSAQAFTKLQQQTGALQGTFKALDGTLRIIGFSTFPQITLAVTTAVDGMRALTNAARIAAVESAKAATAAAGGNVAGAALGGAVGGAGGNALAGAAGGAVGGASLRAGFGVLARTAGPLAVIGAGVYKVGEFTSELIGYNRDLNTLEASMQNVEAQARQTADALVKLADTRIASGDLNLSEQSASAIDKLIQQERFSEARKAIDANTRPSYFMTDAQKSAAVRERMNALDRDFRFDDAVNGPGYTTRTAAGKQQQIDLVQSRSRQVNEFYDQMFNEGLITAGQKSDLYKEADIERRNSLTQIKAQLTEMQQLGEHVSHTFASGFSQAFVDFASGTKTAKEAFGDFARSFLSQIAQMIIQQLMLKAISGVFGTAAANGGMFPQMMAAGGMAGVHSVSSPTYFPRFNVVAGEAGREMLTVLARPRMMEVGGMQAVVGSAQGNRLAITSADALAAGGGGGAGGTIVIQVQGTPDFEARVVSNSVKNAQVQVANDMRQDTPISRGVKGLTA